MGTLLTTSNILSHTSLSILYEVALVRAVRQHRTTLVRTAVAFLGVGGTSISGNLKVGVAFRGFRTFGYLAQI
jgi:hypothetical protein